MSDNRIGRLGHLVELVRASATTRKDGTAKTEQKAPEGRTSRPAEPHDMQALRERLVHMLEGTDTRSEEGFRAARGAIVREVVLWEFGDGLARHPEFGQVMETIERALDAHSGADDSFRSLMDELSRR